MAHTDRDNARRYWKTHFRGDEHYACFETGAKPCFCATLSDDRKWVSPYRYESGVPSAWKADQRRQERTKQRAELTRIRKGAADPDDVPIRDHNSYRRPYFW